MTMHPFYQVLDPFLIWCYRLTGQAWLDYVLGTFVLAAICQLLGKATMHVVLLCSGRRLAEKMEEAENYQALSIEALKAGDKGAYEAANKLAKEAFGSSFMHQLAYSGAFLWPVCFALAWMQYRFLEVEFPIPGTDWSLGYIGSFIIIYAAAGFLGRQGKRWLNLTRRGDRNSVLNPPAVVK